MTTEHECKTGLLQAREHAIPFYESQGWTIIDEPYVIGVIGPHRSMMKEFLSVQSIYPLTRSFWQRQFPWSAP